MREGRGIIREGYVCIREVNFVKKIYFVFNIILVFLALEKLGMQMQYGIYNDGSIFTWWHADVDGTLDSWSCCYNSVGPMMTFFVRPVHFERVPAIFEKI